MTINTRKRRQNQASQFAGTPCTVLAGTAAKAARVRRDLVDDGTPVPFVAVAVCGTDRCVERSHLVAGTRRLAAAVRRAVG